VELIASPKLRPNIPDAEIIVNVQGDEPIDFTGNDRTRRRCDGRGDFETRGAGIVTTWEPIESIDDLLNPDLVKVVLDENENAVYFSRSPIPYPRDAVKRHGSPDVALKK
jgi:CMP-2-keto-3-deoxyoctulosonic acid synthetase